MSVNYQYLPYEYQGEKIEFLVGEYNHPKLPANIIEKVVQEFSDVNGEFVPDVGTKVFIPILPPFRKKHTGLLTLEEAMAPPPVEEVVEPEEIEEPEEVVEEPVVEEVVVAPPIVETPRERIIPEAREKKTKAQDVTKDHSKGAGKLHYKLIPYTFSRPNETIEAVVRLYNDMSTGQATIKKLVYEFTRENMDALPPKLGQTVQVPVLLPFVYRHVNDNKIFKDA